MESFVCTDAFDPAIARHLFGVDENGSQVKPPYKGPLFWRVHLRRGAFTYRGRELPVTSVIGVPFTDKDYRPQG